jgi:transposase-like protein
MILMLVRWYLAYSLSYQNIEELALERGLKVDHSTINRWVIHYAPQLEETFRKRYPPEPSITGEFKVRAPADHLFWMLSYSAKITL